MKLNIEFGAMAPLLETQLGHQGLKVLSGPLNHLQKDADALSRLSARGVLSDGETRSARRRLMKAIMARVDSSITTKEAK